MRFGRRYAVVMTHGHILRTGIGSVSLMASCSTGGGLADFVNDDTIISNFAVNVG